MKTYGIKIALRGVSPMIWRRLRVPGNTSLAQLHRAIQIAYHWDDDYLHQFHIYGKDYGTHNSAGFAHAYGADAVTLDDWGGSVRLDSFSRFYSRSLRCFLDF